MTISPLREIVILCSSFLSGIIIGVTYDILKRIKRQLGFNSLLVDIGDIIIFVVLSVIAYFSVYIINDGKVRWYEIFGIFSGFFMYMSTLSAYVTKGISFFEGLIKKMFLCAKKILRPFIKLFKWCKNRGQNMILTIKKRYITKKRKKSLFFSKIKCIFRKI